MAAEGLPALSLLTVTHNTLRLLSDFASARGGTKRTSPVWVRCRSGAHAPVLELSSRSGAQAPVPELSRKEAHRARKKEQWKLARKLRKRAELKKTFRAELQKIHSELKYKLSPQKANELKTRISALLKNISKAKLQGSFEGLDNIDLARVGEGRKVVVKDVWLERKRTGNSDVWVRADGELGLGLMNYDKGQQKAATNGIETEARIGVHVGRNGGYFAKLVVPGRRESLPPVVDYEPLFERARKPVDETAQVQWLAHR